MQNENEKVLRSNALLAGYWIIFSTAIAVPAMAITTTPSFESLFESFGAQLPALTLLAFELHFWLLLLPFPVLVPAIISSAVTRFSRKAYIAMKLLLAALVVIVISSLTVFLVAMYLPILQMGMVQ